MEVYNSPMADWKDEDIRLLDEAYIGVSTAFVLLMVIGAALIWYKDTGSEASGFRDKGRQC